MSEILASNASVNQQYGRKFGLFVSDTTGKTVDLSSMRVKFQVKKTGYQTPNIADILIYNLSPEFALTLKQEFTSVIIQAGYISNYGTIFKGNIKQAIVGRESATDTFLNLLCGDGDQAYNFSTLNTTVGSASAGGATAAAQLDASINALGNNGVGTGYVGALPTVQLPRGKVMYGNARDYIKAIADTNGLTWSIQDGNIIIIPETTYLPNEAVTLNAKSGVVGTPQQTIEGIKLKCLLNPKIKCHARVQINNAAIQQFKLDPFNQTSANVPVSLSNDGMYYTLIAEHSGDTRGTEWYTNLVMLTVNQANNPLTSVGSL